MAEEAVRSLAHPDGARRLAAFEYLSKQGRYVEPIIRRVLATDPDERVRVLCRRLLLTEFVTELKATIHDASNGKPVNIDPRLLRAHLARTLRGVGLIREAHAEAISVLNELEEDLAAVRGKPGADGPRQLMMEIRAAALDASGVDRSAAAAYADCIKSRSAIFQRFAAVDVAWLQDWWIGRGYGQSLVRAGTSAQAIAELEARLASQTSSSIGFEGRLNCVYLAYLYEARGEHTLADRSWNRAALVKVDQTDLKVVQLPPP
jgi:hypothetical protein